MAKGSYITKLPAIIPSCVLWLDANDPSGNNTQPADSSLIATWVDKSGKGNSVIQGTTSVQPSFKLNVQGEKPAIRFDGGDSLVKTPFPDISQFTAFCVGKVDNNQQSFYEISTGVTINTGTLLFADSNTMLSRYVEGPGATKLKSVTTSITLPTSYNIWESFYDGTNITLLKNGGSSVSTAASTNSNVLDRLTVGSLAGGAFPLRLVGDICELLIYSTSLSADQKTTVRRYLSNKWGIAA